MDIKKSFSPSVILSCVVLVLGAFLAPSCSQRRNNDNVSQERQRLDSTSIDTALCTRLHQLVQSPRVSGQYAFYVYDLTADKPVYGHNERLALPSASCMKLLTGVAGIYALGSRFMYETTLYMRGQVKGGTLLGDATFKAGLDPQLDIPELNRFAQELRRRGVSRIGGRMIVDLTITEPVKSEEHWYPWDLSFSRYGLLYKGSERVKRELKHALRAQGIAFRDSQMVEGRMPVGSHTVFRYYRGLQPIIQRMWKNSSNTQATSLLYTIGYHAVRKNQHSMGSNTTLPEEGVRYLRRFLRDELGQKDSTLVIHDGCGLCTYNRLSPQALVAVLRFGYRHEDIRRFLRANLSISGVDGTLRREMGGPKLRGKIYAKTGTLSHPYGISSLAGYCKGGNGHMLAFAIMDSEMSVLDARVLQRKLCEALVK